MTQQSPKSASHSPPPGGRGNAPQTEFASARVQPVAAAQPSQTLERLEAAAAEWRGAGREVVVVQGLGFVGAAVAAAVASARDDRQRPRYLVIGVDLPSPAGLEKIAAISAGASPIVASDPELARATRLAVQEEKNLIASWDERALGLGDIIIVDVPLDAELTGARAGVHGSGDDIRVGIGAFEQAIRSIGREMRADALVLVETTVPVGVCERVVMPILREERGRRGIDAPVQLAHAYERVTPGPNYLASIRKCFRVFSGVNAQSRDRARVFLSAIVDTENFPLHELADTDSSELAKLLENSYRAVNIALIHEWTLLAEKIGIDLFAVIDAIRRRRGTHDNMRVPGFGVGGYCLTKDSLLAQWSADRFFGGTVGLDLTLQALDINRAMPLHAFDLAQELAGAKLMGAKIAVLGASYLPDVADARNSPTATLVDALLNAGAKPVVHDPVLGHWFERPDIALSPDLAATLAGASGVVLAVAHGAYGKLSARDWIDATQADTFLIDANNVLSDDLATALHQAGRRLLGVGKGHWRKQGLQHRSGLGARS